MIQSPTSNPATDDIEPRLAAAGAISSVLDLARLSCDDLALLLAVLVREAIQLRCPTVTEAIKLTTLLSSSLAADLRQRLDADRAAALAETEPASPIPS